MNHLILHHLFLLIHLKIGLETLFDWWLRVDQDLAHAIELTHSQRLVLTESCRKRLIHVDVHLGVAELLLSDAEVARLTLVDQDVDRGESLSRVAWIATIFPGDKAEHHV